MLLGGLTIKEGDKRGWPNLYLPVPGEEKIRSPVTVSSGMARFPEKSRDCSARYISNV